jgi:hypothetical protein
MNHHFLLNKNNSDLLLQATDDTTEVRKQIIASLQPMLWRHQLSTFQPSGVCSFDLSTFRRLLFRPFSQCLIEPLHISNQGVVNKLVVLTVRPAHGISS